MLRGAVTLSLKSCPYSAKLGYQPASAGRKVPMPLIDPVTPNPGLSKLAGSETIVSLNTASNEIETQRGLSIEEAAVKVSLPDRKEYSEGFPSTRTDLILPLSESKKFRSPPFHRSTQISS